MDKTQPPAEVFPLSMHTTLEEMRKTQQNEPSGSELILSLFQIRFLMHAATPLEDAAPKGSFQQLKTYEEAEQLRRGRTPLPLTGRVANQVLQIKELERMKLIQPQDLDRGRQAWQITTFGKLMVIQHQYIAENYQQLMQPQPTNANA